MTFKTKLFIYSFLAVALMSFTFENSNRDMAELQSQSKKQNQRNIMEERMSKADKTFAFEFFERVLIDEENGENKNFMVSPLSLSMALTMTMNGAEGETRDAVRNTLKMGAFSDKELNNYYRNLKKYLLNADSETNISIANSIWTNKFIPVKCAFKRTNKKYYDAEIKEVDFSLPTTANLINQWASDNTNNLIDNIIDRTNGDDLIYLLNAIYFKGNWSTSFDKSNTVEAPFFVESDMRVKVDMMHQTNKFDYTEDANLQMIKLPYGNKTYSMMVLLPQKKQSLKNIAAALRDLNYWETLNSKLYSTEVDLALPKFKTKYSKRLEGILSDMGMAVMFSPRGNFSKISKYPANLSIVKQDSYISTDEEGTEAAAVTMVARKSAGGSEKVTFRADRPFIYIIKENNTDAILFMGVVKNF